MVCLIDKKSLHKLFFQKYNFSPPKQNSIEHLKGGSIRMRILNNWEQWKDFLGDKLHQAQKAGLDQEVINNLAQEVGDYLQVTLIRKMNNNGSFLIYGQSQTEEQQAIANVMVKLVQNNGSK